jgi:Rad3-related DNA helicase
MLTERDQDNITAVIRMMALARVTVRPGLRAAIWHDVAIHLQRLREVEGRTGASWEAIVSKECGLGKSRAYQIMALTRKKSARKSIGGTEKMQQNQSGAKSR